MTQRVLRYLSAVEFSRTMFIMTAVTGFLAGVGIWVISLALQRFVIEPYFCQSPDAFNACQNGGTVSLAVALFIGGVFSLIALVKMNVYRPLLVIIASFATLYGVSTWLGSLLWYEAAAIYGLLLASSYVLFAWIARLASFWIVLLLTIGAVVAFRLLLIQA